MTRSKTKGQQNANSRNFRFINISLTKTDQERLQALADTDEYAPELIFDLVASGYKVSVNEDTKNNSYVSSISDVRPDSPHYGYILTGRGSTAFNSFLSVCYKHYAIAEQDWSEFIHQSETGSGNFG